MLSTHSLENYLHFAYIPAGLAVYFPSLQARSFAKHFQQDFLSAPLYSQGKEFHRQLLGTLLAELEPFRVCIAVDPDDDRQGQVDGDRLFLWVRQTIALPRSRHYLGDV